MGAAPLTPKGKWRPCDVRLARRWSSIARAGPGDGGGSGSGAHELPPTKTMLSSTAMPARLCSLHVQGSCPLRPHSAKRSDVLQQGRAAPTWPVRGAGGVCTCTRDQRCTAKSNSYVSLRM